MAKNRAHWAFKEHDWPACAVGRDIFVYADISRCVLDMIPNFPAGLARRRCIETVNKKQRADYCVLNDRHTPVTSCVTILNLPSASYAQKLAFCMPMPQESGLRGCGMRTLLPCGEMDGLHPSADGFSPQAATKPQSTRAICASLTCATCRPVG